MLDSAAAGALGFYIDVTDGGPMPLLSTRRSFGSLRVRTPPVAPGLVVGVMGGSFDPPHEGHAVVAQTALRRLRLDRVWWVVTPGNPLKANGPRPSLAGRMAACRRLARHPRMHVTGFETDLGTPYTAIMLAFLRRRHSGVRFVWLMGADNLAGFHRWQSWRTIAATHPIAVVDRPGWRLRAVASPAAGALARHRVREADAPILRRRLGWVLLTTRLSTASSTALRARSADPRPADTPSADTPAADAGRSSYFG